MSPTPRVPDVLPSPSEGAAAVADAAGWGCGVSRASSILSSPPRPPMALVPAAPPVRLLRLLVHVHPVARAMTAVGCKISPAPGASGACGGGPPGACRHHGSRFLLVLLVVLLVVVVAETACLDNNHGIHNISVPLHSGRWGGANTGLPHRNDSHLSIALALHRDHGVEDVLVAR